jgi:hypothetical protein
VLDVLGKGFQGVAANAGPDLVFQSTVQPFQLGLGLGMGGAALYGANAQAQQAGLEPGQARQFVAVPAGVVTE